ncbi:hypothetical protein KYK29_19145 [Shinella daejeonensis]|uniref:DUF6456 domain-containing protein n=1 Tax=Shinella daejeonensis TaxID=659017 RepID=UPI0020C7F367|nr:hypothetical protein [Shinella daejeonensis]
MTGLPAGAEAAALARLLRLLLRGPALLRDGDATLSAADGKPLAVAREVAEEALRLGLAHRSEGRIHAGASARTYLKRQLCEKETPFADQHRVLETVTVLRDGHRERALVNRLESPLAALARLKEKSGAPYLPEAAIAAGERLHADFMRGGLQPRMTMNWEPRIAGRLKGEAGAGREIADTALAARARVASAVEAMGPELSGIALDVCCFAKGLETVERERQWPARSAKLMLRTALLALARHYAPQSPVRRAHAWGGEGFRPDASGFGGG